MLSMKEKIGIWDDYYKNGMSISGIAKKTRHDRKAVRGIINQEDWNAPPPKTGGNTFCPNPSRSRS
jgi:hypothetical protein